MHTENWKEAKTNPPTQSDEYLVAVRDEFYDAKCEKYNEPPVGITRMVGEFNIDQDSWTVPGLTGYAEVLLWMYLPALPAESKQLTAIKHVRVLTHGNISVSDEKGQQIAELQDNLYLMWAERAKALGYEVVGIPFLAPEPITIGKTDDGELHING